MERHDPPALITWAAGGFSGPAARYNSRMEPAPARNRKRLPALLRWPLKTLLFLTVLAFTLYPDIRLLPRNIEHVRHMNEMLDPAHPGLAPLEDQVRKHLGDQPQSARRTLDVVQRVVYERLQYGWDWDVWGVADYMPTVDEALSKGREDCDGRAVVAASLLKRMGHEAWLVSDIKHVWVQTKEGETMSPGRPNKSLVATPTGTKLQVTPSAAANLGSGLSYGVAVFPLPRELILVAALALLAMQPGSSLLRRYAGAITIVAGLLLVRAYGRTPREFDGEALTYVCIGFGLMLAGWLILLIRTRGGAGRAAPPASERPA